MRDDYKEICMTCKHARHAGEVTQQFGLYTCPMLVQPARDHADSEAVKHVLVDGDGIGCTEDYEKDHMQYEIVWRYELAEERENEGKSLAEINGVVPGVDFPQHFSETGPMRWGRSAGRGCPALMSSQRKERPA